MLPSSAVSATEPVTDFKADGLVCVWLVAEVDGSFSSMWTSLSK